MSAKDILTINPVCQNCLYLSRYDDDTFRVMGSREFLVQVAQAFVGLDTAIR